jgi:hypothetical protein
MATTHATTVTVPDDGVSPVGSDEWNAAHAVSLANGEVLHQNSRVAVGVRMTLAGSSRLRAIGALDAMRGTFGINTAEVLDDNWLLQYKRARLAGNARLTVAGTGELFVFDLAPVGRLVLAGRGG